MNVSLLFTCTASFAPSLFSLHTCRPAARRDVRSSIERATVTSSSYVGRYITVCMVHCVRVSVCLLGRLTSRWRVWLARPPWRYNPSPRSLPLVRDSGLPTSAPCTPPHSCLPDLQSTHAQQTLTEMLYMNSEIMYSNTRTSVCKHSPALEHLLEDSGLTRSLQPAILKGASRPQLTHAMFI